MRVGCIEDRWIVLTRILDRACFVLGKSFLPISIVYTYLFQGLAIARRTLGFRLLQSFLELALRLFLPVFLVQILPFMFVADMRDVAGACAALRRRRVAVDVRRPCSAHRDGGRQCGSPFFFWASWPRGPAAPGLLALHPLFASLGAFAFLYHQHVDDFRCFACFAPCRPGALDGSSPLAPHREHRGECTYTMPY